MIANQPALTTVNDSKNLVILPNHQNRMYLLQYNLLKNKIRLYDLLLLQVVFRPNIEKQAIHNHLWNSLFFSFLLLNTSRLHPPNL